MRLWISLHLYRLGLDCWRLHDFVAPVPAAGTSGAPNVPEPVATARHFLERQLMQLPAVLFEHDRVYAVTPAAARLGVRCGMRRSSAQALAPQLITKERNTTGEAELFEQAALAMLQYTPEVVQADEHVLLLGVGASLLAFGGPRKLCRRIWRSLRLLGVGARLGMAPTAQGAWLLARQEGRGKRRRVLTLPSLRRLDNSLSCLLLPEARPYQAWLQDIGCRSIGGLLRLPRSGLQQRTGPGLLLALDRYQGRVAEPQRFFTPPPVFNGLIELPEHVEQAQAALYCVDILLEQLTGWLAARHEAATALQLELRHERGRHAMPPTVVWLRLAEPAWQRAHMRGLLAEKLGRVSLPAPVIAIRLSVEERQPLSTPDGYLLPDPGSLPADRRRLLELLVARLGREQVLQSSPCADHRPEVANNWKPVDERLSARPIAWPAGLARPFWMLREPEPLAVRNERPVYGATTLRLVGGPERIEAGWWDGALTARDYFVAEDAQGARYWVYRERNAADAPDWYLHGVFA